MTYLIITTLALAHVVGMAITHGMERRRTIRPDPLVYALWEVWLYLWALGKVIACFEVALRWAFTALDDLGYRMGR